MEDKFNIDDSIVLNPKGNKINNIKKILTAVAILIVLFLIVLILMRFINSDNTNSDVNLELPSEQKLDANLNPLDQESKQEPKKIIIKNTSSSPKQDREEKNEVTQAQKDTYSNSRQEIVIVSSKKAEEEAKRAEELRKAEEAKRIVEAKRAEAIKKAQDLKKLEEAKKAEEARKIAEAKKAEELKRLEEARKAEKRQVPTKNIQKGSLLKSSIAKGDYIQVLAVSIYKPDDNYIKKLTNAGYSYRLYKVQVSGKEFTKILVGPYSAEQLQKELSNIRATINKKAFKYTVK